MIGRGGDKKGPPKAATAGKRSAGISTPTKGTPNKKMKLADKMEAKAKGNTLEELSEEEVANVELGDPTSVGSEDEDAEDTSNAEDEA